MNGAAPFGVLPVLKLPGPTSHDLVRRARRVFGTRKVGHGGTLDPAAAGVLPILLGPATRLSRYLLEGDKSYRFIVSFGVETDTDDQTGNVVRRAGLPSEDAMLEALPAFRGTVHQTPSPFSALKSDGRIAHREARAGRAAPLAARTIAIHRLAMTSSVQGGGRLASAVFDVECSHGTYVRVLAREIAARAGSAGHVSALLRTRTGPFGLAEAVPLAEAATVPPALLPPETVLQGHPKVALAPEEARAVGHGRVPEALAERLGSIPPGPESDVALFYEGGLFAIARAGDPDASGEPGGIRIRAVFAVVHP